MASRGRRLDVLAPQVLEQIRINDGGDDHIEREAEESRAKRSRSEVNLGRPTQSIYDEKFHVTPVRKSTVVLSDRQQSARPQQQLVTKAPSSVVVENTLLSQLQSQTQSLAAEVASLKKDVVAEHAAAQNLSTQLDTIRKQLDDEAASRRRFEDKIAQQLAHADELKAVLAKQSQLIDRVINGGGSSGAAATASTGASSGASASSTLAPAASPFGSSTANSTAPGTSGFGPSATSSQPAAVAPPAATPTTVPQAAAPVVKSVSFSIPARADETKHPEAANSSANTTSSSSPFGGGMTAPAAVEKKAELGFGSSPAPALAQPAAANATSSESKAPAAAVAPSPFGFGNKTSAAANPFGSSNQTSAAAPFGSSAAPPAAVASPFAGLQQQQPAAVAQPVPAATLSSGFGQAAASAAPSPFGGQTSAGFGVSPPAPVQPAPAAPSPPGAVGSFPQQASAPAPAAAASPFGAFGAGYHRVSQGTTLSDRTTPHCSKPKKSWQQAESPSMRRL